MLVPIVLIAIFGVLLPWMKGLDFLDPVMIAAYSCLGMLYAGPAAARAFAQGSPATPREAWRLMLKPVWQGEALAIAMIAAGVATVNISVSVARGGASLHVPELDAMFEALLLGMAGTVAFAAIGAWITLTFSQRTARRALRAMFLLLAFAFLYWPRRLPEVALQAAALCALAAAGMILLVNRAVAARGKSRAMPTTDDVASPAPNPENSLR